MYLLLSVGNVFVIAILGWGVYRPFNANLMSNSLIIAFLNQETAKIDQAMPAAVYAYANIGK